MMTQAVEQKGGGEESSVDLSLRSDSGIFPGTQFPRSVNFRGQVTQFLSISSRQTFSHQIWNGEMSFKYQGG